MRVCGYCGKENDDSLVFCAGCGTALPAAADVRGVPPVISEISSAAPPILPTPKPARVLGAGSATIILSAYLGAQVAVGIVMGILGGFLGGMHRMDRAALLDALLPSMLVLILLASGLAAIVASVMLVPASLTDRSPTGAAWARGSWPAIVCGLLVGILVAFAWTALSSRMPTEDVERELGPITRMAIRPGPSQYVWIVSVLLLAPPFEELLFRGVLYGGYRKSLGPVWAATLTTVIFILLHITEIIRLPFAFLSIGTMALAALACRLRFGAIGPAIAVHFGYNAAVTFGALNGN